MNLHPIFQDCCRSDSPLNIDKPFRVGDFIYATDAMIAVRTFSPGVDRLPAAHVPPVEQLDWTVPAAEWVDLPDVGHGQRACETCEGSGRMTPGEAWPCEDCDGRGFYRDWQGERVGPITLARGFIGLLRKYGVTRVRPTQHVSPRRPAKPMPMAYFTVDGFEGLLMGMESPKRKRKAVSA